MQCEYPGGCSRPAWQTEDTDGMVVWEGQFYAEEWATGDGRGARIFAREFIGYRCREHGHGDDVFGSHSALEASARRARKLMELRVGKRMIPNTLIANFCTLTELQIAMKKQELEKHAESQPAPPPVSFVTSEELDEILRDGVL